MIFHQPPDKNYFPDAYKYVVLSNRQETSTISTLFLVKMDGTIPVYQPGQYITVYFTDFSSTLGKQYSISSAPCEGKLSITVKAIGRFSNRLCSLKKGDVLLASPPEGDLYTPTTRRKIVMIAGGMGVTPFRSIIFQTVAKHTPSRMILFHSSKYKNSMPFLDELNILAQYSSMLIIEKFLTQERLVFSGVKSRRMQIEDILQAVNDEPARYLICGSLSFVLGIKNALLKNGIGRDDIRTEAH